MSDGRAGVVAAMQFLLGEPDAMSVDGAWPEMTVVVVDVQVVAPLGIQLADPRHLVPVLGHVGLQVGTGMFGPELARHLHLLRRARGGESWRYRIQRASATVPFRDQRARLVVA